ncbi:LysR substrate-binding domain-containing protein [Pseudomonas sp. SLFW]|uniref:LysR substrate-binding domain-containing protein n=1 Tax=Pseudomonas sp. SLFW TaxID=2683259 RepID=UPI001412A23C|nr:LysR substrate-binding domain-containing protein [Pseudomonas sp. SLFW]NBB08598.1 LysR family transcriptional regulator [Pseudomonas sp. SLFW]
MHFDLIDLKLFLHVTEAGNITAGAARSHLSLPSASARIRGLESSLGVALLERGRRGVTPTAAGKALAQHARLILQQVERLQADLTDYAHGFKGQIRLLCNTSALSEYLPEKLADFLARHPNIDISLEEHPSLRILHAVRHGAADIGIISNAVDASDLQTLPFCADPLTLIMPFDHPLTEQIDDSLEGLRFSQTLAYEFVGLGVNSAMAIYLEEQALHLGRRIKTRVRAESFDGVLRMVLRGAGLGVVPQAAVERFQQAGQLKSVPLIDPWADRKLLLCAPDFAVLPTYAKALVRHLAGETAFLDTSMSSPDN